MTCPPGRSSAVPAELSPLEDAASVVIPTDYKKMFDRTSVLAKIGVWECDLRTEDLTWTDAVYDMFEIPRGSPLVRSEIVNRYEPASRKKMERARAQAIASATGFSVDASLRGSSGPRWIRITGDVEHEHGRPARIFGTKQDITQEKLAQLEVDRLQAELIHLARHSAMNAVASTLAHELNQPLGAISSYSAAVRKILEGERIVPRSLDTCLEGIERCALRAGKLIRSVRTMTDRGETRQVPFELATVIREAGALALLAAPGGTAISYDLEESMRVTGDPVQIQQVVMNLMTNAWEAQTPSLPPRIRICAALKNGYAEVGVEDCGAGVPAAFVGKIFDSFVTTKPSNSGMGLSICRTIIEAHSGTIWCENGKDGGALFLFRLPAISAVSAQMPAIPRRRLRA